MVMALLTPWVGGCASSGGFDGRVFRDGGIAFRIGAVPAEWRRIDVSDANLAFRDDTRAASILVNGRCGHRDDDTPLRSLTQHLIIGTTEREIVDQRVVPFDGREAVQTVMRAKLDGVQMSFDIFVTKKDGCIYDLVYVAAPDRFAEGTGAFERFAAEFHTLPEAGGR